MKLDELEFQYEITDEIVEKLKTILTNHKENTKWLTIECTTFSDDLYNGIHLFRGIYDIVCQINDHLYSKTALVMDDNATDTTVKIKLFDTEPKINKVLIKN